MYEVVNFSLLQIGLWSIVTSTLFFFEKINEKNINQKQVELARFSSFLNTNADYQLSFPGSGVLNTLQHLVYLKGTML